MARTLSSTNTFKQKNENVFKTETKSEQMAYFKIHLLIITIPPKKLNIKNRI